MGISQDDSRREGGGGVEVEKKVEYKKNKKESREREMKLNRHQSGNVNNQAGNGGARDI